MDDDIAGLGNDAKPKTTTQFAAKAHAPNHQKITRALAYNACINGARLGRPVDGRQAGNEFDALVMWLDIEGYAYGRKNHDLND